MTQHLWGVLVSISLLMLKMSLRLKATIASPGRKKAEGNTNYGMEKRNRVYHNHVKAKQTNKQKKNRGKKQ